MIRARFLRLDVKFPYSEVEGLRISFNVELTNTLPDEVKIWDIEGIVYASSTVHPKRYYLGRAKSDYIIQSIPSNTFVNDYVSLDLTYDQLEKLERIRRGERLRFELTLHVLFTTRLRTVPTSAIGAVHYTPIEHYSDGSSLYLIRYTVPVMDVKSGSYFFEVSVDDWLGLLSKLGFKHVRVIEVPMIKQLPNKHLENAINYLDKAVKLMLENIEESLNACRKALEELKDYLEELGLLDEKREIDFVKIYGGESFGDAVDRIYRALRTLTSIGSHTGRSRITKRGDMEFIITTTYMLLKSVVENTTQYLT
jgi:hypothetical protein